MFPFPFSFVAPTSTGIGTVDNVYSMEFDGVNDYFDAGVNSSLVSATNFSVSGWFYFDSVANFQTLFSYGGSTGSQYCFNVQISGGTIQFAVAYNLVDASTRYVKSSSSPSTSTWYHVVCTYDGSETGNTNRAKIYIDGVNVTTTGSGTINSTTTASTGTFNIGWWEGSARYMTGKIDEVAVFDYTLDSDQVQEIYDATSTGVTADLSTLDTPPVAWYRMGD